ncbi:MAG: aminoacyl-tRNA hydrolase [Spirochaetales bacterium]|nr:aminoacyl-tRNA hydrolase [Spirochaetales bacterium]
MPLNELLQPLPGLRVRAAARKKQVKTRLNKPFSETIVLAGLGNPGSAYTETRHNVGFLCIDGVAEKEGISLKKPFFSDYSMGCFVYNNIRVVLIKPLTYMNKSGLVLPAILKKYETTPDRLIVAVDNMDLHPGSCRLKLKGSSAGHNGLKSIISVLGTAEFNRLYIGVGRPAKGISVVDHVLGLPQEEEQQDFYDGVEKACHAFYKILEEGTAGAMSGINSKQA